MNDDAKARLTLSSAAQAVLERSASPRKRGELVSRLLLAYGAGESGIEQLDVESLKLSFLGLASANKMLESRLLKVERTLAAMMSNPK